MSGPAWTTTYQVALGGGYGALTVDCVSALPDWSATTWFRARAMLPRWSQLPTWMCEIWDDEAPGIDADTHLERLRRLAVADDPVPVTVATDGRQLDRMIDVAGPVVAWGGVGR